jgi:ribosomal protein S18 acetylase RimI-like enzyme
MPDDPSPPLRRAGPADAAAVRALVRAAYAKWVPLIGREPRPMQADYALAVQQHRIDLLHRDGALAALIETRAEPDHLWIENVAVAPECQGQGLGRRLLRHAEALATAAGLAELRLLTNGAFAANIALYRALGYRITSEEPWGDGVVVFMAKPIDPPGP